MDRLESRCDLMISCDLGRPSPPKMSRSQALQVLHDFMIRNRFFEGRVQKMDVHGCACYIFEVMCVDP